MNEFDLIDKYFRNCGAPRADVPLGIGDDAALLACPPGEHLVAAVDTLVEGIHFPAGSPPESIGHRALAVNLSDMAAMGALPAWALLALTLPSIEETWVQKFTKGFGELARRHNVSLVGGDTTKGPLTVSVQIMGFIPIGQALLRSGGKPGDLLFISGTLGDAAAGLNIQDSEGEKNYLKKRFQFPEPRIELGQRLRPFASACIDVSDGLLGDAGKLAAASACGVEIDWETLPVSRQLLAFAGEERARVLALTGGDDYELCFAVRPENLEALERQLPARQWGYTRTGQLRAQHGAVVKRAGNVMDFSHSGYDHFGP
jgi:thiamine-monophosphate kinase